MIDVSVIIPTLNSQATIDECIKSIVKQCKVLVEIIIVDNGSSDNTLSICKRYKNIVILNSLKQLFMNQETKGLKKAR